MSFIEDRKKNHIEVCLAKDVSYHKTTGLEKYEFIHNALPDMDFKEIDTKTEFLGKSLSFPLIISGMTGGARQSAAINRNLALAAEKCQVAMGVGSQRISLEKDNHDTFRIREYAPHIALLGNIGAVQLNNGVSVGDCRALVEVIGADALVLHLNAMQEIIQAGDTDFRGLSAKIRDLCRSLGYPVIVKEVGFGISGSVGKRLEACGVYAVDVSGAGGISWSAVESFISPQPYGQIGKTFWDWGIPTAECIIQNKGIKSRMIAGGGIRNGLDMAKALALGADYISVAGTVLGAAMESHEKVEEILDRLKLELRAAMFCLGVKDIAGLKQTKDIIKIG